MKSYIKKLLIIICIFFVFVNIFYINYSISEPSDSFHYYSIPISKMQILLNIIIVLSIIILLSLIFSIIKRKKIFIIILSIFLFLSALCVFLIPVERTHITGGIAGENKYEYNNIFSYTIYTKDNKIH